jgi:hypothetical protein
MKKIFQQFLDNIISMLATAIERKIERTSIKVVQHTPTDEIIRVFENTVMRQGYNTIIHHHKCDGYSISVENNGSSVYKLANCRTLRALYEQTLSDLIEQALATNAE